MIVNAKLACDGGGNDNIKSWIAKLPDDNDVSTVNALENR